MTQKELDAILVKHFQWLQGKECGECADLSHVDLCNADLHCVHLSDASLRCANLCGANLRHADLAYTDLNRATLAGADLTGASLRHADLTDADLTGADLTDTDLNYADLSNVSLDDKEKFRMGVILQHPMKGYKKMQGDLICELLIPKGAIVFCINGGKCRTNRAKVLNGVGHSRYDLSFIYKKGESYEIKDFNLQYNVECAPGIHFFRTRKEAEDY